MAARYWVGGTGTWDSTNTANWSATSGGAGGASVPTSADTPQFNSLSGTGTVTFTNGGVSAGATTLNTANITLSLGAAFSSSANLTITAGTFTTNNYNVTVSQFSSSNSNVRTINLGSSTVSLNSTAPIEFSTSTNLTFNAGTSQINLTSTVPQIRGGSGVTFYNVTFTSGSLATPGIRGANTFNNLTITGRTFSGICKLDFSANQTISGTLSISAGTDATCRIMLRSTVLGTQRTLSAAAMSATDVDFQDILITGAAAPLSGTRLGDCKGNSGITFGAAKTVYFRGTGSGNWGNASNWSATSGGTADSTQFPLAQDTAIIPSATYPASGSTITMNAGYNLGTVDMSGRTTNTVTLSINTDPSLVLGNWINGTGTTISGVFSFTFTGRNTQTITSAGKAFSNVFIINSPGGSVVLQDALTITRGSTDLAVTAGTFDANNYNVTLAGDFSCSGSNTRTVAIGAGTWVIQGGGWSASTSTNLTVTGTGTISLTSTTAKSFQGGNIQTYPTVNQGGAGTLTFQGSNKFAGLTNTAIGRIQFTGGTTNEFGSFVISGVLGNLLQLGSTNTTQAILKKPTAWNMGLLSTDAGNNTGLNFLSNDGTMEYLSVSYINGQLGAANYVVTANNGTYSLTGQNATIAYAGAGGYTLVANNGTYAVTGQAASLLRSRLVSAVYGTYALTGQNATLLKSRVMLANTGTYSVAGQAAIVVYTPAGGAYTIMAGSGLYAVTGQSASLSRDRLISGGVGTYNTTGFAATIQKTRIVYADNGSYTVAGQPAAVVVSGITPIVPTDDLLIKLRSFTERRRF
jgi:hypothetical protein